MSADSLGSRLLDGATRPFDGVRRLALAWIAKSRVLTRVVGTRDLRVPTIASVQIALFFALAVCAPIVMFVVGPLLLGVPHLASDVRYLLLRRRPARALVMVCLGFAAALLCVRAASWLGHPLPRAYTIEIVLGTSWVLTALALGTRARPGRARAPLLFVAIALAGAWMLAHPLWTRLILAHGHNVFGVVLWFVLFRRAKRFAALPLALVGLGVVALLSGSFLPTALTVGDRAFGMHLAMLGRSLAPGADPHFAVSVVLSFVFLQSVHYATWLAWVPQEELPGQGTFTFRMTARGLLRDFGAPLLMIFALLWAALAGWSLFSPQRALGAYISLVSFHAWLEFALAAYLWARAEDRR